MKLSIDGEPTFYMAGLARLFPDADHAGLHLQRFVILTTAANTSVAPIHDRMPLIVPRHDLRAWLNSDQAALALLRAPVHQQLQVIAAG